MTDVRFYSTEDGGEIDEVAGQLVTDDGLEAAILLSLFGGNEDDSGIEGDDAKQWWGNFSEPDQAKHYRSETAALLRSIPATPANLTRIQDAGDRDLAWLLESGAVGAVNVSASMPAVKRVQITIHVEIDDRELDYVFTRAWLGRLQ